MSYDIQDIWEPHAVGPMSLTSSHGLCNQVDYKLFYVYFQEVHSSFIRVPIVTKAKHQLF